MGWVRCAAVVLALIPGVWMTLDGMRALVVGDYVTPRSGPYAGQLGPWHRPVAAVGIDPRGTPIKLTIAGLGFLWLAGAAACALGVYLALGSVVAIAEIGLALLLIRGRSAQG